MGRIRAFFGGIDDIDSAKQSTAGKPISVLTAPETLVVSLLQHAGAEAKPVVAKGDEVLKGQLIAEADGVISANIHSPVSGKVLAVEPRVHPNRAAVTAIVIENDWEERWVEKNPVTDPVQLSREEILNKIREAGIVGMGGAGFPTAVKLNPPKEARIDYLILNGCECEPYLSADDRLMIEYAEDVILGAKLIAKAANAGAIIIALEDNKPEAYEALKAVAGAIDVVKLPTRYPQGAEKQLIQAVTGREVPTGSLPFAAGCIVNNVGTAWAVAKAVRDGEPLISRVVTVSGETIREPQNFLVPIGTPLEYLLEQAGGFVEAPGKVIVGGPMMGGAQFDLQASVGKTVSGVIALAEAESHTPNVLPCIRCARCVDVCPANLLPLRLEAYGMNEMFDHARDYGVMDCIECGCCTYICPSKRPLLHYIQYAKREIAAIERNSK